MGVAVALVAFFGMILVLVWLATVFFSGGPGFGPEMDLGPGYGSLPTPYEAPVPPTPEEAAAACQDARNGQVSEVAPYLVGCDLSGVDLSGAIFLGADLSRANLSGATLVNANLQDARMALANIAGADLTGANLKGADLFAVIANLTAADLASVTWSSTTCPDGSNSDDHGNTCVGFGI